MLAQQARRDASGANAELENRLCLREGSVGDQFPSRAVLVESLRILPPPDPIVERPRCRVSERRLGGHGSISRTMGCAVCGHAPTNSTDCWTVTGTSARPTGRTPKWRRSRLLSL